MNPYESLHARAFWSPAVAKKNFLIFQSLDASHEDGDLLHVNAESGALCIEAIEAAIMPSARRRAPGMAG